MKMLITTTETISGYEIKEVLGLVRGNTVKARDFANDFVAGLRNIVGGEIKEYTELLTRSRDEAIQEMQEEAEQLGANAIISMRLATSAVSQGAAEILAYGTAVKIEKISTTKQSKTNKIINTKQTTKSKAKKK